MKIKNELVSIKNGDNYYDFNNLILDEYLNKFVKSQLDESKLNYESYNRKLEYCLLKFDTPIENLKANTKLRNYDFDICLLENQSPKQNINENIITIEYSYGSEFINDYNDNMNISIKKYCGKKITAIGFITDYMIETKEYVCSILDTSNYNIYIQENQELCINRKDIITTDAIFYSNNKDKVPGPVHLAPFGVPQIIHQNIIYGENGSYWAFNDNAYGILYSVGLSSYSDYIDKEFVISKDIQLEINNLEIKINGLKNYLSTDSSIFPSSDIYPGLNVYPIKSNYKYIIFKYKIWQIVHSGTFDNILETSTDTGYYYYQAIPINKFGKSNLTIKYERG